jgi:hypothetical protein
MRRSLKAFAVLFALILSTGAFTPVHGQAAASTTVPVTAVVTVLGPKYTPPPALSKDDISVYAGKNKSAVTGWTPAQGDKAGLQLAIVIDEASTTDLALQFGDLKNFINGQPKSTAVGIFYASNAVVQPTSQFSTDHEAVTKGLRLPIGRYAYSSIYLSMISLMDHWTAPPPYVRREILLISDGIDRFRGDPFSPDVDNAYRKAEQKGIIIHTLYATGIGRVGHNLFRVNYGQSNLAEITDKTGGESFFQGLQTPISFAPFLEQLDMILKNQYFLQFEMDRSKKGKGELRTFRVRTEQKNVDISAADQVFVPGVGK